MTLTGFLLARIADDEARAQSLAGAADWIASIWLTPGSRSVRGCVSVEVVGGPKPYARMFLDAPAVEWGWVLHDSAVRVFSSQDAARVLAECEAKRRIVEIHAPDHLEPDICSTCASHAETYPCRTLRALAAVYSDHPDFDEAWRA